VFEMPANVETMFYVRELPWHGLGVNLEEAPNSEKALIAAGLDWEVIQKPIYINVTGGKGFANFNQVPNRLANIRSTDNSVLGIVSNSYKVLQNKDAFKFTDELLGEGVKYETAGSLSGGRRIWLLARLPEQYKALGDEIDPYFCLSNSFDTNSGLRGIITPVRVVCQNTLNMALREAKRVWSVYHSADISSKMDEARKTLQIAHHYYESFVTIAEKMGDIKVDFDQLTEKLFPVTEDTTKIMETKMEQRRSDLQKLLAADDLKKFQGTAWGFVNGVSDMVSHARPMKDSSLWRQTRMTRALDGFELLDQAFALVQKAA
jgi:phage/plasmid-like protein (TIGR03299 family)